ncbi:MAG: VWA domain-containing protein [Blastocatellia bacterium]
MRIKFAFQAVVLLALAPSAASYQDRIQQTEDQKPIRVNATLVQVPALVTDKNGKFVTGLSREDFTLSEDGKRQEISLFAPINQAFNCVLVLDTSNSAEDRLGAIRSTAVTFTRQLSPEDRMMILTFDNEVRELTELTANKPDLEAAIRGAETGFGKLLYEAVTRALERLKDVEGRRAVVLFSDGIDMRSIEATAESSVRLAEEIGAVIYCVKFDTRWWIEAEARRQEIEHPRSKTPGHIDGRIPVPPDMGGPEVDVTGFPKPNSPRIEVGQGPSPPVVTDPGRGRQSPRMPSSDSSDEVGQTLDKLYGEADSYLQTLASRTGGKTLAAETLEGSRSAFSAIAEELRNQYLVGYYATHDKRDGKYHKIKLEAARKGVQVRARLGYRSPAGRKD